MNKNSTFVFGIVVILLLSGLLIWWFVDSNDVQSTKTVVSGYRSSLINDKTIEKIKQLKIYGNFPIKNDENYSNEDLFN